MDHRGPGTRTKARKRALDILFEADLRDEPVAEVLADRVALASPPVRRFTIELVEGVAAHRAEVDAAIAGCLREGWTLERMPRVDRSLARIAAYELLHTDTEPTIAIDEAVSLAAELSTDDSPGFLNGVLGALSLQRQENPAS